MDLLVTDLDQTLIYSHKAKLGQDRVLVETKDGQELSFMTAISVQLLNRLKEYFGIVPLTTRSLEQYKRIIFPGGWIPYYALVANGAILLRKGLFDEAWYEESRRRILPSEAELCRGAELLQKDPDLDFEVRTVDGVFVFTKSRNPESTKSRLQEKLDMGLTNVLSHGNKLYILPKMLHKGTALERLRAEIPCERIFCAGDSEFDLPMLDAADFAFAPEDLLRRSGFIHRSMKPAQEGEIFSDAFLRELEKIMESERQGDKFVKGEVEIWQVIIKK